MPLGILPSGLVGAVSSPSKVLGILSSGLIGEMPWGSAGALDVLPSGLVGQAPMDPLSAWVSALGNRATAQARAYWIGDSIFEGTGASIRARRVLDMLSARLAADYPVSGQGMSQYLPAVYGCPKTGQATNTTWGGLWATTSGTVSAQLAGIQGGGGTKTTTFGPGLRSVNLTSTNATATYAVYGTALDAWFAAGGSFTYSVDGGAFSSAVNTSGWNANGQLYQIALGASGPHTIAIRRSSGTVRLLGFTQFDGARDKGIALFDACHWGAQTIDFWDYADSGAVQNPKLTRSIQLVAPHLVVINTLINDAGVIGQQGVTESINRLTGMLAAVKAAAPGASVAFCQPYDQAPDSQLLSDGNTIGDLKAAVAAWVASNGLAFINLSALMPPVYSDTTGLYQSDGMHLTDAGEVAAFEDVAATLNPRQLAPDDYAVFDAALVSFGTRLIGDGLTAYFNEGQTGGGRAQVPSASCVSASTAAKYWEVTVLAAAAPGDAYVGLGTYNYGTNPPGAQFADPPTSWSAVGNGNKWVSSSGSSTAGGVTFAVGDVVMMALIAGSLYVGKNGTWVGDPNEGTGAIFTGLTGTLGPAIGGGGNSRTVMRANFGAKPWAYTPPAGATGWAG